jgi:hypothetical protein
LLNASQQLGGSLGLAVLTAVATARFDAVRPQHPTPAALASANTSSWAYAFVVGAGLLIGAAIVGGLLIRPIPGQPHPEELTPTDEAIDGQKEGAVLVRCCLPPRWGQGFATSMGPGCGPVGERWFLW